MDDLVLDPIDPRRETSFEEEDEKSISLSHERDAKIEGRKEGKAPKAAPLSLSLSLSGGTPFIPSSSSSSSSSVSLFGPGPRERRKRRGKEGGGGRGVGSNRMHTHHSTPNYARS